MQDDAGGWREHLTRGRRESSPYEMRAWGGDQRAGEHVTRNKGESEWSRVMGARGAYRRTSGTLPSGNLSSPQPLGPLGLQYSVIRGRLAVTRSAQPGGLGCADSHPISSSSEEKKAGTLLSGKGPCSGSCYRLLT